MSRRIHFEDDGKDPRQSDYPSDADGRTKRRKQQKIEHEEAHADINPKTSAAPIEPSGAAFSPVNGVSSADSNAGGLNVSGLQHGAANLMRNIAPDETPDRNTAVSATRFALELGATAIAKTAVKANNKRKSKLKNKDSSLKFEQDEKATDGENQNLTADEAEQTESPADNRDVETDGDNHDAESQDSENINGETEADKAEATDGEPTEQCTADVAGETDSDGVPPPPSGKPKDRLKFSKEEKAVNKHEKRAEALDKKLEKAGDKIPTKTVKKKTLVYDEKKGKNVTKLTHEKEKVPIGEAKWNQPTVSSVPKAASVLSSVAVTKIHAKVHQVEHENTGVKVAHKAELLAESGYRGAKQSVRNAYRFHRNRPYRRVAKLEQKSIKNKIKLDYHKALRDNPKLKSNPISRFMQKRVIKRNYAKDLRAAKKAAATGKKAVGLTAKAGKVITAIIRKNPVFLVKMILLGLIIFLILSMVTMCVGMFSGTTSFVGAVTYAAEVEDIDAASILYTELETDLRVYIDNIESNYPGYDEYRISVGDISHNPFVLMSFLSAVYEDFTFTEVEAVIRAIFDEQYTLSIVPEVEIRTRTETHTGTSTWTDEDGNTHTETYTYTVEVEYEWHILNVTLISQPMSAVLNARMDSDQRQHFNVLMMSNGARQIVGNPFDFDWLPNLTSLYGYRIHPISGVKQFHWGVDIALPTGTPILAGLTGTVVAVGYDAGGYGNYVVIEDVNGLQARYAHCHEVLVSEGQTVDRGDVIATVGNTGASTGAHLHMEISIDGQRRNPIFFVETGNEGQPPLTTGGWASIPAYPGAPMDDAVFAAMMDEAMQHLGKPYVFGASGPNSFDCSGFVSYVVNRSGWSIGRLGAKGLSNICTPVSPADAQPGDLVFFWRTYDAPDPNAPTHVGIYIGNGMMIHAGSPVSYASINTTYWQNHFWGFGRLP